MATEAQLIDSLQKFALTSANTIGIDNTVGLLQQATTLVEKNPALVKKIFKPENLQEFDAMRSKYGDKEPDAFTIMAIMGKVKKMLK